MQEMMEFLGLENFGSQNGKVCTGKVISFRFPNAWGASVITSSITYGNQDQ